MTTNNEAQQREDMLMDLYKIHAYIPNDAVDNPLTPFGNFCCGYDVAKAECEKEIAELKAWANRPVTDNTQVIANMEAQIAELKATIETYIDNAIRELKGK